MEPFNAYLGVKITHVLGGLSGGIVTALIIKEGIQARGATVIVGGFTAAYMTTPAYLVLPQYIPIPIEPSTENALSYVIGISGMVICEGIIRAARAISTRLALKGKGA